MNPEFHLDDWLPRFPLQELYGHYEGCDITGPRDICNIEWLRRGMVDEYDWGTPVLVDLFILSKGEPEHRFTTKIGGLPYRPLKRPWPCSASGRSLSFIAQFNFSSSIDLVGNLPADLLLVFGDTSTGLIEPLHMEWQLQGDHDLVGQDHIPSDSVTLAPYYGNRCRMPSYPKAVQTTNSEFPQCHGKDVWSDYWILQLQATQIGRAPYFIQEGDDSLPGQPLCTINSIVPTSQLPYPFINVPEPLGSERVSMDEGGDLLIGDLGCIYIFIEADGTLHSCTSEF